MMNLTFKCDCGSTMTLDFKALQLRAAQQRNFEIRCQACSSRLDNTVAYQLFELIKDYQQYEQKWEFEFKLTPKEPQT
ncbi:hypothetical protein [Desulfosporosinus youngiae]|uniref:Uncharacterized protein n=1 Tax=Desulfosporosinus youngiae DSM 17734 TaxID=768710 RepID=H5Y233_9FIRM|nr:hypothetical protein [Desulfosporosinus youngiae]EHQ88231.1 hypothetical protein DesyoDRAFT_1060 [Desulfosporosinus youngiae DSM 17734]